MLACRSVYVKLHGIQVSTHHAHSRQSGRQNILDSTWQQCLVTMSEDILTTKYDVYLKKIASLCWLNSNDNDTNTASFRSP